MKTKGLRALLTVSVVCGAATGNNQPRLPGIREQYERAPGPKDLLVVEGSAHAQAIFDTKEGPRVLREIIQFIRAK